LHDVNKKSSREQRGVADNCFGEATSMQWLGLPAVTTAAGNRSPLPTCPSFQGSGASTRFNDSHCACILSSRKPSPPDLLLSQAYNLWMLYCPFSVIFYSSLNLLYLAVAVLRTQSWDPTWRVFTLARILFLRPLQAPRLTAVT
jgi:hypothetical protein